MRNDGSASRNGVGSCGQRVNVPMTVWCPRKASSVLSSSAVARQVTGRTGRVEAVMDYVY